MPESDLVKTGIKGLDEILFGGIPRGNIILLAETAGTGKTTLGVEFVYRGARQFNEPGVIVLFEVAPDKLIRDAALFGWDLRELERDGRLKMVFTTRQVFQQELLQADSVLLAEAAEIGARRIFVDGLVRLPEPNGGEPREAFHLLAEGLHRENMTAMLALESTMIGPAAARAPEEFVADEGAPGHRGLQPREPRDARHVVDDGRVQGQLAGGQHHFDELGRAGRYLSARAHGRQDAGNADAPNDPRVRDRERPGHEGAPATARWSAPYGALRQLRRAHLSRARTPWPGGPRKGPLTAVLVSRGARQDRLRARRGMEAGPREVRGRDPPDRRALWPRRALAHCAGASNS